MSGSRLQVLHYPDPRLRRKALPVARIDDDLRRLIDAMFATMYDEGGIGLSSIQVNDRRDVIVIDLQESVGRYPQAVDPAGGEAGEPLVLINARITARAGVETMEEGCLSLPDIREPVQRAQRITVAALDRDGAPFERDADGLLAVCIQHELDHQQGKLMVDYLSPLKRERIRRRLEKARRSG